MFNLSLSEQSAFYLGVTDTTIKKKIKLNIWEYKGNTGFIMKGI